MKPVYLAIDGIKVRKMLAAVRHNLREIPADRPGRRHIDPTRSHLNQVLRGPAVASQVMALERALRREQSVAKPQKHHLRFLEVLISLPGDLRADFDLTRFAEDSLVFLEAWFGAPILSAVLHLDESQPHLHVLLVPVKDGKLCGSALIGDRTRLRSMQQQYFLQVSRRFGFRQPRQQAQLTPMQREEAAERVVDTLAAHPERMAEPTVRSLLTAAIAPKVAPLLVCFGLDTPKQQRKRPSRFVRIMTRPVNPEPKPKNRPRSRQRRQAPNAV